MQLQRKGETVNALASSEQPKPPATVHESWTHRWVTKKEHAERYGTLCRVVPKVYRVGFHAAGFGSPGIKVTVEFEDGTTVEALRPFVRRRGVPRPGGWQGGGSRR